MGSLPSKVAKDESCTGSSSSSLYINYILSQSQPSNSKSFGSSLFHNPVKCDGPPTPPPPLSFSGSPPSSGQDEAESSSSSTTPPPPPSDTSSTTSSSIPNPGPYEQAASPCKSLTNLDTYDGFRMDIQKQLSPYMVAIHSFWLGTNMLPDGRTKTYGFVTQVADEDGLYMARYDPEKGTVDGRVHKSFLGGGIMAKLQMGLSAPPSKKDGESADAAGAAMEAPPGQNDQCLGEIDISGLTWTANLKYGSMGGGNIYGMNYYQSITENFAMGGEGMYIAANGNLMSSYTLKYEMDAKSGQEEGESGDGLSNRIRDASSMPPGGTLPRASSWFMGQVTPAQGALNLLYRRIVTPGRVTLGAELQCNGVMESQVTFGAEFNLTRSKVCMAVDGGGRLQTVLETKLGMAPGSPTLNLNADVDHSKETMRFGYGLNVG